VSEKDTIDRIDILLVDDRPENLLALEVVLGTSHYNLIKAKSGYEALRYLLSHDPAVILMDVQMPELNGFETTAIIKNNVRTREIPIIFITAINSDEYYVHQGYSFGAVDYIYKPYNTQVLKSKVAVFADLARKNLRLLRAEKRLFENEKKERERQVAQLELRSLKREQADQKKYRDLVEGINHGIVWSAALETLHVTFVSSSAERILGYPTEQWLNEDSFLLKYVHRDDRARFLEVIRKAQLEKKDGELEHRFLTSDLREIWLQTGLRVVAKNDSGAYEIRGLSIDISKIKDVEERLLQNKMRSDFLADASLVLSGSLDYKLNLERVGQLAVPQIADWFVIDVMREDDTVQSIVVMQGQRSDETSFGIPSVIETGKSELHSDLSVEFLYERAQSEDHLLELKALGLRSAMVVPLFAREKILGAISLFRSESKYRYGQADLSVAESLAHRIAIAIDNANLYTQAQAAIRARDEFLSIASHELKTPLTPLKIQIQGLMRTLRSSTLSSIEPKKIEKMLEVSDRQLARLSKLIDDLLDISRISIGRLNLNLEEFDIVEQVKEVVDRFSDQMLMVKCDVQLNISPSITVIWDRFRIEQVLINLLTNAMKYGPGKPIMISVTEENGRVRMSFQDHGIGIAKQDQHRIFGCFERAVSGNHFGGLGLGLYIVNQILEAHDGKIQVQSEVGQGSIFTVDLPVQAGNEEKGLIPPSEVGPPPVELLTVPLKGKSPPFTILVVDDAREIREVVEELLLQEGHRVATACNGEEGLRLLEDLKPNLVILDTRMPIMDGWEFLKVKNERPELAAIPVLVFCADNKNRIRPPGIEAQGYLSKPIDVNDFLGAIQSLLNI
jgi:PAS domain S-box-containing protein